MPERARRAAIPARIEPAAEPWPDAPREVARHFRDLLARGARLLPAGTAKREPQRLLGPGYLPRYALSVFEHSFFLAGFRHDDDLDFFVGYVAPHGGARGRVRRIFPRIFYKDSSLVFRVATHVVRTENENWIGKGDLKRECGPEGELLCSAEETTNLPFEVQAAFDELSRRGRHGRRDEEAVELVLRAGPEDRMRPYADFSGPRARAMQRSRINGGRRIARFRRRDDPESLEFTPGYEPDFRGGLLESVGSASRLYGGPVVKHRVLSTNRQVQFSFVSAPRHVWINPPQALTTELSTYGVRTVDVLADEELHVPGYEYHYVDDGYDPPRLVSQIPPGYAGAPNEIDPDRADASAWIEAMPVVRRFRREVLERRARR